jgi:hypothetical protein
MIPTQETADMSNPQEHLCWALRSMPAFAGAGMVTHPGFLRAWSEHLYNVGFRHVDWLKGLADENGMIHVSKLPKQVLKFQEPMRGPRHTFNNAARWVGVNEPAPEPMHLPDIRELTIQENEAMLSQYRDAGMIPSEGHGPVLAEVIE